MKIGKNSLLIKIVFYNNIIIILTSLLIAIIMIITSIKEIDYRIEDITKNRLKLLTINYNSYFLNIRNELYKELGKYPLKNNYVKTINFIKEELKIENIKDISAVSITILNSKGKILKELVGDEKLATLDEKEIMEILKVIKNGNIERKCFYLIKKSGKIFSRIILPYWNNEPEYIIVTIPLSDNLFKSLTKELDLASNDKVYFYINNTTKRIDNISFTQGEKSVFISKMIGDREYFLGIYNLSDYHDEYIGNFVLAISKDNLKAEKIVTIVYILVVIFILVLITTSLITKIFTKVLTPLIEIANMANKVSKGENLKQIEIIGEGEIKELSIAFKKMIDRLNITQQKLKDKNDKLLKNIKRIEVIDDILINANIERNILNSIMNLLTGFTSKNGLDYSRAIYFRYSRENDYLIGEKISINSSLQGNKKGFKFQTLDLGELISSIKVPINNNLLAESFVKKRVICKNDYGYKHDFGNDLFKAIGIKNFFIFPIYGAGKFSGVIVVDNYTKGVKIQKEELELLNLLAMNFSTSVIDRENVSERLENQRAMTIEKLATKFLNLRGKVVEELLRCLNSENSGEKIIEELNNIKPILEKIKEDNKSLKNYSDSSEEIYEIISLETLISDIIDREKLFVKFHKIDISLFSATEGIIYGCKRKLNLVIRELLKNSYSTLLKKAKDRRIRIILSNKITNKKIELKIIDNGEGIAKDNLKSIYEPFETYLEQNLGLGLFFVRKIIREHGGVIKHFSEIGKGTEVKITFNAYKKEEL